MDGLELVLGLVDGAIAAQQAGKILREGGARHHRVAARLDRFALQFALDVRQEADDRRPALELGLDLGDEGDWLRVGVIQIEEDERRAILFGWSRSAWSRCLFPA